MLDGHMIIVVEYEVSDSTVSLMVSKRSPQNMTESRWVEIGRRRNVLSLIYGSVALSTVIYGQFSMAASIMMARYT